MQILNPEKNISLSLSGCATQMALVHPQGRVLQYNSRIEVHSRGSYVEKNAKIWPRGISFTASNCAIVYLVDQAGTRSTSDQFHDLYSEDSSECKHIFPILRRYIYLVEEIVFFFKRALITSFFYKIGKKEGENLHPIDF